MTATIQLIHPDQQFAEETAAILRSAYTVTTGNGGWPPENGRYRQDPPDLMVVAPEKSGYRTPSLPAWLENEVRRPVPVLLVLPADEVTRDSTWFIGKVDDFITEPVDLRELETRIKSLLMRRVRLAPSRRVGPVEFDAVAHAIRVDGKSLDLRPAELRLMAVFLQNPGYAYSRMQLLNEAWGKSTIKERVVDVTVRRIRAELEPHRCEHMIQTVRGLGYRFSKSQAPRYIEVKPENLPDQPADARG